MYKRPRQWSLSQGFAMLRHLPPINDTPVKVAGLAEMVKASGRTVRSLCCASGMWKARSMRSIAFAILFAACSSNDDIPAPQLSGVVPDRGVPGTLVTVSGSYFCQVAHDDDAPLECLDSGGAVYFGSFLGTALSWEDTMLMIEVPESPPGEVDLRVQVKGKTTGSIDFVVE